MNTADLYVRVSTDEQAEKGYSQRNQEEVLRRYCEIKSIQVRKVYYEDHSAKTFNRPVWKKILVDLRRSKGQANLILFTKWDRFSRNTGDAYSMINMLRRLGIEPQAIEQPLDLDIPENKMMLAFYLAAPEVENDRRSLNIFHGTRRAKKEGRWVATAPIGYANRAHDNGRKYIAPKEPQATAMKGAFKMLATGTYTIRQVFRASQQGGITCTFNNFWRLLRNPVYCGKIRIPQFQDEEEYLVDGQHEALISEALFYEVLDFLDGRKKNRSSSPNVVTDLLPLRGFLDCSKCTRKLTGSASKGRAGGYYHYYHCSAQCKCRFKAEVVNNLFLKDVNKIFIRDGYEPFYHEVLSKAFRLKANNGDYNRKQIIQEIKEQSEKIEQAREFLLSGEFTNVDFQGVKRACETRIIALEVKLPDLAFTSRNVDQMLSGCISNLKKLIITYKGPDLAKKRRIIGSICPENLKFDGFKHRTTRPSEVIEGILLINSRLGVRKNWTSDDLFHLSSVVEPEGFEPSSKHGIR
jgi:site-specific DNA recombinase